MLENIVEQIMLLKSMIVIAAVGTIALTVFCLIYCRKFSWTSSNLKLLGFFYGMDMADTFVLAVCMLKLFLVISLLFSKGRIELIHIYFFGVLVIVCNFFNRKLKGVFVNLFNGAIIMGVLFVSNLLLSYLREILFDVKIAIALIFLAVFLILYAAYDVGYCVLSIIERRENREQNSKAKERTNKRQVEE